MSRLPSHSPCYTSLQGLAIRSRLVLLMALGSVLGSFLREFLILNSFFYRISRNFSELNPARDSVPFRIISVFIFLGASITRKAESHFLATCPGSFPGSLAPPAPAFFRGFFSVGALPGANNLLRVIFGGAKPGVFSNLNDIRVVPHCRERPRSIYRGSPFAPRRRRTALHNRRPRHDLFGRFSFSGRDGASAPRPLSRQFYELATWC